MKNYAELQYICPNCFSQRNVNDVLFLRNAAKSAPDYRKLGLWRMAHPGEVGPETARSLADWRTYPEDQRLLREGVVVGITDFNGDSLKRRICPECHYPTSGPADRELLTLFWTENGVDEGQCRRFFSALEKSEGKWSVETRSPDPDGALWAYENARNGENFGLKAPLGLINGDGPRDPGMTERYIRGCNAAVVWLKAENEDAGDLRAVRTLRALSSADGSRDSLTGRPTAVFILTGERPRDMEAWLREKHRNLYNALNSLLLQFQAFDWRDGAPEAACEAADWLLRASFGENG